MSSQLGTACAIIECTVVNTKDCATIRVEMTRFWTMLWQYEETSDQRAQHQERLPRINSIRRSRSWQRILSSTSRPSHDLGDSCLLEQRKAFLKRKYIQSKTERTSLSLYLSTLQQGYASPSLVCVPESTWPVRSSAEHLLRVMTDLKMNLGDLTAMFAVKRGFHVDQRYAMNGK